MWLFIAASNNELLELTRSFPIGRQETQNIPMTTLTCDVYRGLIPTVFQVAVRAQTHQTSHNVDEPKGQG